MNRILLSFSALLLVSFSNPATSETKSINSNVSEAMQFEINKAAFEDDIEETYNNLTPQPKGLNLHVFKKAFIGFINMKKAGKISGDKSVISVVDFTKSSKDTRFWIIDIKSKRVLFKTLIAHGRNTGDDMPVNFSNKPNSFMSSVGFYKTGQTYFGKHGLSLKLHGLDKNFNSNAEARAVVMHGADYVSQDFVRRVGRLGRSLGCPAVPDALKEDIIATIKNNTCLYIHGNVDNYNSQFLNATPIISQYNEVKPEIFAAI